MKYTYHSLQLLMCYLQVIIGQIIEKKRNWPKSITNIGLSKLICCGIWYIVSWYWAYPVL